MAEPKELNIQFSNGTGKYEVSTLLVFPYIIEKNKNNAIINIDAKKEHFEIILDFAFHYKELSSADRKLFESSDIISRTNKEVVLEPCFGFLSKIDISNAPLIITVATILRNQVLINILCGKIAQLINGAKIEDLRTAWNVEDDLTEQDKKDIAAENEYLASVKE